MGVGLNIKSEGTIKYCTLELTFSSISARDTDEAMETMRGRNDLGVVVVLLPACCCTAVYVSWTSVMTSRIW